MYRRVLEPCSEVGQDPLSYLRARVKWILVQCPLGCCRFTWWYSRTPCFVTQNSNPCSSGPGGSSRMDARLLGNHSNELAFSSMTSNRHATVQRPSYRLPNFSARSTGSEAIRHGFDNSSSWPAELPETNTQCIEGSWSLVVKLVRTPSWARVWRVQCPLGCCRFTWWYSRTPCFVTQNSNPCSSGPGGSSRMELAFRP